MKSDLMNVPLWSYSTVRLQYFLEHKRIGWLNDQRRDDHHWSWLSAVRSDDDQAWRHKPSQQISLGLSIHLQLLRVCLISTSCWPTFHSSLHSHRLHRTSPHHSILQTRDINLQIPRNGSVTLWWSMEISSDRIYVIYTHHSFLSSPYIGFFHQDSEESRAVSPGIICASRRLFLYRWLLIFTLFLTGRSGEQSHW